MPDHRPTRKSPAPAARAVAAGNYHLKLYVSGATSRSTEAISTVAAFCEKNLPRGYKLDVIDIYQQPNEAQKNGIMVAPTLVRVRPAPSRRFTGDFSKTLSVAKTLKKVIEAGSTDSNAKRKKPKSQSRR